MIEYLCRLIDDVAALHSKLILLVGPPGAGKTAALNELSQRQEGNVLNIGATLAGRLTSLPKQQRGLQASHVLRELAATAEAENLLLLDNLEALFDAELKLDPLALLKKLAHGCRVVAVWPGEVRDDRLCYAPLGHPEHRSYELGGVVTVTVGGGPNQ